MDPSAEACALAGEAEWAAASLVAPVQPAKALEMRPQAVAAVAASSSLTEAEEPRKQDVFIKRFRVKGWIFVRHHSVCVVHLSELRH